MKFILRSIIRNLLEGHFLRKTVDTIDKLLGCLARFLYSFTQKTKNNKVVFYTKENQYSCNPKYICEELLKRDLPVDIVWAADTDQRSVIPGKCRLVEILSSDFYEDLLTAKIIVTNSILYTDYRYRLRKDQKVIQTWHGSLGFKKIGKDENKSSLRFVKAAFQSARMTDCCITNSEFENEVMRSTYWPDTKLLEYGHARNDIFFDGYAEKRRQIRKDFLQQHNLPEDCKLLLYAPTFRDDDGFDAYGIDVEAVMDALRQRFGGQWYLMLRYHPVYRKIYARNNIINGSNVIDVTLYPDMQEILTLADAGITDYSSWILDYVLQRKPGFLYASDIARYNKERGFYYPLTESPFPLAENNEQLIRNILEFNEEEYKEKVEQFLIGKGCVENGTASRKTVDYMLSLMNISEMKQADK